MLKELSKSINFYLSGTGIKKIKKGGRNKKKFTTLIFRMFYFSIKNKRKIKTPSKKQLFNGGKNPITKNTIKKI